MIKILIISIKGHEEFHMPVAEATDFIRDQCENKSKWAYLDGDYINPNAIADKTLISAKEIMLVNVLAGG